MGPTCHLLRPFLLLSCTTGCSAAPLVTTTPGQRQRRCPAFSWEVAAVPAEVLGGERRCPATSRWRNSPRATSASRSGAAARQGLWRLRRRLPNAIIRSQSSATRPPARHGSRPRRPFLLRRGNVGHHLVLLEGAGGGGCHTRRRVAPRRRPCAPGLAPSCAGATARSGGTRRGGRGWGRPRGGAGRRRELGR